VDAAACKQVLGHVAHWQASGASRWATQVEDPKNNDPTVRRVLAKAGPGNGRGKEMWEGRRCAGWSNKGDCLVSEGGCRIPERGLG